MYAETAPRTLVGVSDQSEPSGAKAVLAYNLMRLGLLVVCLAIGWFAGLHDPLFLFVAGFLVSGLISWFVLKKQRLNMGAAIERTVDRGRAKMAERTAAEDAAADQIHASDTSA